MQYKTILINRDEPFVFITLNRPSVRNAMNEQMILELLHVFTGLREDRSVRGVVLSGAEGTFCAGGDVREMQAAYANTEYTASTQTQAFDDLLKLVNTSPQVVVTKIDGAAMGGGLGLVCVSDVAIATIDTVFALPEVRLGIVPALISPYVIQRVGLTSARRLMLTGARFDGHEAVLLGFTHDVAASEDDLDLKIKQVLADIREASPQAIAACKQLMFSVYNVPPDDTTEFRANLLDHLRTTKEGQEGMLAFIQKRKPEWAHNK